MDKPRPTPAAYLMLAVLLLGMLGSLGYLATSGTGETKLGERVVQTRFIRGLPPLPWYEWVERQTPDGPEVTTTLRWYTFFPALALGLVCFGTITWWSLRPRNWVKRNGPDQPA